MDESLFSAHVSSSLKNVLLAKVKEMRKKADDLEQGAHAVFTEKAKHWSKLREGATQIEQLCGELEGKLSKEVEDFLKNLLYNSFGVLNGG